MGGVDSRTEGWLDIWRSNSNAGERGGESISGYAGIEPCGEGGYDIVGVLGSGECGAIITSFLPRLEKGSHDNMERKRETRDLVCED